MALQGLLPLLTGLPSYRATLERMRGLSSQQEAEAPLPSMSLGLPHSARAMVVAALQEDWPAPILLVTDRPERSRDYYDQLQVWSSRPERIVSFPAPDTLFYDRPPWDRTVSQARVQVLTALGQARSAAGAQPTVILAPAWALMQKTVPPLALRRATHTIAVGSVIPLHQVLTQLVRAGYEAAIVVEEPGTFSHRGSLVDVFPAGAPAPVRIDLFGDEVDSIRQIDAATQRSGERLDRVSLPPAHEALPEWGKAAAAQLAALDLTSCNSQTHSRLSEEIELIAGGGSPAGFEFYLPYLYPRASTLLDHLPSGSLVLLDDLTAIQSAMAALERQAEGLRADLVRDGDLPERWAVPYHTAAHLSERLGAYGAVSLGYGQVDTNQPLGSLFSPPHGYGGQVRQAMADIAGMQREGRRVVLVTRQSERVADLLLEESLAVEPASTVTAPPAEGSLTLVDGVLAEGCHLPEAHLSVLTDSEMFGWVRPRRRSPRPQTTAPESLFADLKEGDYVVHIEYGIGRYHGMVRKSVAGLEREYIELEYEGGDRLFVPIHDSDRISRYIGADDREPYLHRLGSADWTLVKGRAERAVRDIARELLELYALRETSAGHAFPPDTAWQHEMEGAFPYTETDDQLRAVEQIKGDMEQPRPMDRLLVGDVGYGKTEVAVRAAFKAVMDGKQVAILVPTTILAQQHYYTFRRRLRAYPVTIEMLSRFRSPAEQDDVIERLAAGQVDIVIGTHRLLSKDVAFRDLGLLVVDEEQRFGVAHKERLKRMRSEVDVLTMTATPIPRTLYMSLSGIRDMSVIDTPPENRVAVRTQVTEYDAGLIRRAILREMDRGGQVYFVHNRVRDIELVAHELQEIVPEASILIGHGQMPEDELAQVMLGFAQGEGNVLLCTTIIENGLDIANVNTIIIDRADTFGLSQLYQLRGRVGRGIERAYAYLLFKPPLTTIAHQRLETIQEASELGAGYRVAMRDMEIRGAGELLGAEQHGHIAAIGFDLYTRLLRRAIEEFHISQPAVDAGAAETPIPAPLALDAGPTIDLPLSAYLPHTYIVDDALRLRLYRRLARVRSESEVAELDAELKDRFGAIPEPTTNLMYILRVRLLAAAALATTVRAEGDDIVVTLAEPLLRATINRIAAACPTCRARGTHVRLTAGDGWQARLLRTLQALANSEAPQPTA